MKASDAIEALRENLARAQTQGMSSIPIEQFQTLVDLLDSNNVETPEGVSNDEQALEWYRALLANRNARWAAKRERGYMMVSHTVATGVNALKAATLVNGGAAVATMALLGTLYQSEHAQPISVRLLIWSLVCFGGGVFFAAVATGATYLSQAIFGKDFGSPVWGHKWRKIAIGAAAAALLAFPVGAGWFSYAFLHASPSPTIPGASRSAG